MANPMQKPDYAMLAGLNNRGIPFPASGIPPKQPPKPDYGLKENIPITPISGITPKQPPKPDYGLKENIPITPISGGGATGVPGTATRPSYPPEMSTRPSYPPEMSTRPSYPPEMSTRPSTNLAQLPPAQAQQQNPWGNFNSPQGWGQQFQYVRPPQGFGGGGYPQLPGGMQPPPWMQYYQNPSGGAGMGFGGGMQMPMGAQNGYQNFQNQYQNPFAGYYVNRPTYQPMPTLPTTPGAPNMPQYYRPGAMPSGW